MPESIVNFLWSALLLAVSALESRICNRFPAPKKNFILDHSALIDKQIPNPGGSRNSALKFASIDGLNVRNSFVAAPGMSFITVDFQQCELRVLAHCCGE